MKKVWPIILALILALTILLPAQAVRAEGEKGTLTIEFKYENGDPYDTPITVTTTKDAEGNFLPDESSVAIPPPQDGYIWSNWGSQAPSNKYGGEIILDGREFDSPNVTWSYYLEQQGPFEPPKGRLVIVFCDADGDQIGNSKGIDTYLGTDYHYFPVNPRETVSAPFMKDGHEWKVKTQGAEPVDEDGNIHFDYVELETYDIIWQYQIDLDTGSLRLVFLDEDGNRMWDYGTELITVEEGQRYAPVEVSQKAPELAGGYSWIITKGAKEIDKEDNIALKDVTLDNENVTWTYKMVHSKGVLNLEFVDENDQKLEDKTITRKTSLENATEFALNEGEDSPVIPPDPGKGYRWVAQTEDANPVEKNGSISLKNLSFLEDNVTWTYKKVPLPKGTLHLVFVDENGKEVAGSPIDVATTENTKGEFLADKNDINAPKLTKGYKWVAQENAAQVNEAGRILLSNVTLPTNEVTWTYKKTPVKGLLHLVFVDENGNEIDASPIDMPTTQNTEGKFLTDKTTVDLPEPAEGYEWVAQTAGAAKVNEDKIDLYWAELENDEVTWTYQKTSTAVRETKGVLHLVFVDENGKEVAGSPIDVVTTENSESKFLTDETDVKAPKLAEGYEWVAQTKGAAKVNDEGKIDLYWAELENDDVTWTYALRPTEEPVTPTTPAETKDREEKPDEPHEMPAKPTDKEVPRIEVPYAYAPRAPWRLKQNATAAPKTATKGQTKTEAKVDSAKHASPAVTTIPATGEARVPLTAIGVLLLAATALLIIRRKTR